MSSGVCCVSLAILARLLPCQDRSRAEAGDHDRARRRRARRASVRSGLADLSALLGIVEGRLELLPGAQLVGNDRRGERRAAGGVGILIGGDLLPCFAGVAQLVRWRRARGPSCGRPLTLMCETWTGSFASLPIFRISSSDSSSCVPFVADVRGIDAAVLGDDFRDRDQLVGLGKRAGRVNQPRRHAAGAVAHRLVGQLLHFRQLRGRRRPVGSRLITLPRRLPCGNRCKTFVPAPSCVDLAEILGHVGRPAAAIAGDDRRAALHQEIGVLPRLGLRRCRCRCASAGR